MKVLLVEDDYDLIDMYDTALSAAGYSVATVGNAQEALDYLENKKVDVVVLDLLLPGHNGLDVLHELRTYEDWRKLPVIILSNLNCEDVGISAEHLRELGVAKYLIKSQTKPHVLVQAIAKICEPKRVNL